MTLNDIIAEVRTAIQQAARSVRKARRARATAAATPRLENLETRALLSSTLATDQSALAPATATLAPASTLSPNAAAATFTVSGNGITIVNASSPLATNGTEWGTVAQNSTPVDAVFSIVNNGSNPLTIANLTVPAGFKITNPPSTLRLLPTFNANFTVELPTDVPADFSGNISFQTNDPVRPTFTFGIHGKVLVDQNVFEPDNTSTQATVIPTDGTAHIAALGNRFDIDWVKFTPTAAAQIVTVQCVSTLGDGLPQITLWGPDDATVQIGSAPTAVAVGTKVTSTITANDLVAGSTYYVKVEANNTAAATSQYNLSVLISSQHLNVTGLNSTPILNGQTVPNSSDGTDFGTADPNTTLTRTFTLTNSGTAPITIGSVLIVSSAGHFTVATAPAASIPANGSTSLVISLDTSALGSAAAVVSFNTSDPSVENPFNFAISGLVQFVAPVLQFNSPVYSASQSDGSISIIVTRTGSLRDPLTVDFTTSDATAVGGLDYVPITKTLSFASGISTVSVDVSLLISASTASPLFFTVALSNPTGTSVVLGPTSTATVNIVVIPPSDNQAFVNAVYNNLLGRDGDPDGLDYFTSILDSARSKSLSGVANQILSSAEHLYQVVGRNGGSVFSLFLHRLPSTQDLNYFVGLLQSGTSLEEIIADVVSSTEYFNLHANDTTASATANFVNAAYEDLLGRGIFDSSGNVADPGAQAWIDNIDNGVTSRLDTISNKILNSVEYRSGVIVNAFHTALQRAPQPTEISFWLDNYHSQQQLLANVMGSTEAFHINGNNVSSWLNFAFTTLVGRPVDAAGLSAFSVQIATSYSSARQQFVSDITGSNEYRFHSISTYYTTFLGRQASDQEINIWINTGLSVEQVESTIISSDEYFLRAGGTNQTFVNQLYVDVLGREVDPLGNNFVSLLDSKTLSRRNVIDALINSTERRSNVIISAYNVFLGRNAAQSEVNFWLGAAQTPESTFILIGSSVEAFIHLTTA